MASAEYFRKQADLYSRLAGTTADEELRAAYRGRALDFLAKANAADDGRTPHIIDRQGSGDADAG